MFPAEGESDQHVAVKDSIVNMLCLGENLQELMSVLFNFEYGLSLITAMGNMINLDA